MPWRSALVRNQKPRPRDGVFPFLGDKQIQYVYLLVLEIPNKYRTLFHMESSFFHIYNRGVDRRDIFTIQSDYAFMVSLFDRYLSPGEAVNNNNRPYPSYRERIRLHAFCLMPNHFHLVVEELEPGSLPLFMQGLKIAYCKYYNLRHGRNGVLFESNYRARQVLDSFDLQNLGRYVHLNPRDLGVDIETYAYSSLRSYLGCPPEWLETSILLDGLHKIAHKMFHSGEMGIR